MSHVHAILRNALLINLLHVLYSCTNSIELQRAPECSRVLRTVYTHYTYYTDETHTQYLHRNVSRMHMRFASLLHQENHCW